PARGDAAAPLSQPAYAAVSSKRGGSGRAAGVGAAHGWATGVRPASPFGAADRCRHPAAVAARRAGTPIAGPAPTSRTRTRPATRGDRAGAPVRQELEESTTERDEPPEIVGPFPQPARHGK